MFDIYNQKFGFELEFSGISKSKALQAVNEVLQGRQYSTGIVDLQGREWKVVYDGSVNRLRGGDQNELVSPPLKYEDIDSVQLIVRALRRAGARVDASMGMHVHVDLSNYNAKSLKNLIKYYAKYERMFYKSCSVLPNRANHFAKKLNERHPNLVEKAGTINSIDRLKKLWYGNYGNPNSKYCSTRYSGLNLHNIWNKGWYRGTVEFRFYNSTLHAGEVRSYITLSLAISAKALNANSVSTRSNTIVPDECLFPKVLVGMGITPNDETTRNVYKHLIKNMRTPA